MKTIKILSVDWDYFFPATEGYDWGLGDSTISESFWHVRCGNRNILNGMIAVDEIVPNQKLLDGFWDRLLGGRRNFIPAIANSHIEILKFIANTFGFNGNEFEIVNIDAHHDWHYGQTEHVNCGNWASWMNRRRKLSSYTVWYPEYRKRMPEWGIEGPPWSRRIGKKEKRESKIVSDGRLSVKYGAPSIDFKPDAVFVCRSPGWSPTWCDRDWVQFASELIGRFDPETIKACVFPNAFSLRSPNAHEARLLAYDYIKFLVDAAPVNLCLYKERQAAWIKQSKEWLNKNARSVGKQK